MADVNWSSLTFDLVNFVLKKQQFALRSYIHLMEGWERGLVILKMRNVFNCISIEYISGVGLSQSSMMTEVTVSIHWR